MRNKIYDLCFPTNTTVYPTKDSYNRPTGHEDGIKAVLSLASTCRQIRTEVVSIYYGSNMFSFSVSCQMYRFTVNIGKDGREAIRQLEFPWDYEYPMQPVSRLGECISLQRLHIGLNRTMMPSFSLRQDIWEAYGISILRALHALPPHVDLKIREVGMCSPEAQISPFFEGVQPTGRPMYPLSAVHFFGEFDDSVVEKFEAMLKEERRSE